MNRNTQRNLLAAAAAAVLLATSAVARADNGPITREQVRAELAEARALGMLDKPGEIGTTDDVLQAREMYNQTQTRVLIAQQELEQRLIAEAQAAEADQMLAAEQVSYTEADEYGNPVVVMVSVDADGNISYAAPVQIVAVDME